MSSLFKQLGKAVAAAGAAVMMITAVAACGPSASTPSEAGSASGNTQNSTNAKARTLDEIKKSGELRVAVFSDKAPFGYVDKDGKYAGYDIEFAQALADGLGVKPVYTSVDPAARVDVLASNKVDVTLANFTETPERAEKVDFSKPYMKVALGIVAPDAAPIKDVKDLNGKTLIVAKGTTAETYFEKNHPEIKLQKYDAYAEAKTAFENGNGVAWANDNTEVIAFSIENPGYVVGIPSLGSADTIAPAVTKGNTTLLNWLNDEIKALGNENFFHADYEATLVDTYGTDYEDSLVVEGGETSAQ